MLSQMLKLKRQSLFADRKAVISQGMLKCVGSSIFLKSKWGIGYRLRYRSFFFFLNYFCLLNFWLQGLPCCAGFPHFPRAGAALQRGVRLLIAVASRAELRL